MTWYQGKAYGVTYGGRDTPPYIQLLRSTDGVNFRTHVSKLFGKGWPTEVTLRFAGNGTCYALVRRDRHGDEPNSAVLGVSSGDYRQWNWHDLGPEFNSFGGPNFIQLPSGHWIGAGRMHQGGAHTAVTLLDMKNHKMTKLLKLPSGGDTSYPGLLWYNNTLYVSYYSSHEGKTSIYLAKLNVTAKCPRCSSAMKTVPVLVGLPTTEMTAKLKRGKALLAGCVGDPHNPEYACICPSCRKFKTVRMTYWRDLPAEFGIIGLRQERSQK